MATTAQQLQAIYDNAATTLAAEIAYEAANGPKPSYSLNGRSYQWMEYKEAMVRFMEAMRKQINAAQPYIVRSRGRSGR
jgi:hypothetical protein